MPTRVQALVIALEEGLKDEYIDTLVAAMYSFRGVLDVSRERPEAMDIHIAQIRAEADLRQRILAVLKDRPWTN